MKNFRKESTFKFLIFFVFIIFFIFLSYLNFSFNNFIINQNSHLIIKVKSGDSVGKTISLLRESGYINSELRFKILAYLYDYNPIFKNGTYRVNKRDTEYSLLGKLIDGKVIQEQITIIEGSTYNDIKQILLNNSKIDSSEFDAKYEKIYISRLNYVSLEGLCFPDTYKFAEGITYEGFISNCISKMNKMLSRYWAKRDFSLPYKTKYEMLTMASIIEKETSKSSEKPLVASVFINRLNKNMRLQADPTVIYGMKNFQGNITKKDLNAKNEYNTYKINGLPKTPICSPSESSIKAASKPSISKYLYFVSNNKGEHIFSETYDEHLKAVNKYQK